MEATNSNELGHFGNQDLQSKENSESTRGKINIWIGNLKHFLMSILQKHVIEINIPNFIYSYL